MWDTIDLLSFFLSFFLKVVMSNNNVGLNGKGVGVPVKLMHESEGHVVTVRRHMQIMVVLFSINPF